MILAEEVDDGGGERHYVVTHERKYKVKRLMILSIGQWENAIKFNACEGIVLGLAVAWKRVLADDDR